MKKQILVVEDNDLNRALLCGILSDSYRVLEAGNGQEALDILRQHKDSIALIILDMMMPVMDGRAFLERIRDDAELSLIPVIVTTQSDGEEDEIAALAHGATDFVPKPYRPQVILHRVASLIKLRENAAMVNHLQYDRLTGLYSKDFFFSKVRERLLEDPEQDYCIVCSNIENFKLFNDIFGVQAGDRLLKETADIAKSMVGSTGFCGRFSADRFLCLQSREQERQDRLNFGQFNGSEPSPLLRKAVMRWGIYEITDRSIPVEQMCDRALLAANSIKGQYQQFFAVYDDSLRDILLREQAITAAMEPALAEEQFEVYYQPKYSLDGENIAGAEALVRWIHPEWGFMSPGEFIPLFEKNGFISRLDQYVWEKVCVQLRDWTDKGYALLPVSVNLSRADVFQGDVVDTLLSLTEKYGIDPSCLHLEITESAYAEKPEQIIRTVEELRRLGFIAEMDDFGSGYSSLNMLSQMSLDILKLDMKFIQNEFAKPSAQSILGDVVSMAHRLHLGVTAEGVETQEQVQRLKEAGCDYVQGYYFAKPMPAAEFEKLWKRQSSLLSASSAAVQTDSERGCASAVMPSVNEHSGEPLVLSTLAGIQRREMEQQLEKIKALNTQLEEKQRENEEINAELSSRIARIQSMSDIYTSAYYIDLETGRFTEMAAEAYVHTQIGGAGDAAERLNYFCRHMTAPSYTEEMLEFVDLSTLESRLGSEKIITKEFLCTVELSPVSGDSPVWTEASFIEGARTPEGRLSHVVFATRIIHDAKLIELHAMEKIRDEMEIAGALSADYPDVVLLDFLNDTSVTIKRQGTILPRELRPTRRSYRDTWDYYISKYVVEEDRDALYTAVSAENVRLALAESDEYSCSYRVITGETGVHYFQASFIRFHSRHNSESQIILGFRCVDAIVEKELENRAIQNEQLRIIGALSREYSSLFKIDAGTRKMTLYRTDGVSFNPTILDKLLKLEDYELILTKYIDAFVEPEDRDRLKESVRLSVLLEKVPDEGLFKLGFRRNMDGVISYFEMNIVKTVDENGGITLILGLRDVDEEARRQLKQTREMEVQREIIQGLGSEYYSVLLVDPCTDSVTVYRAEGEDGQAIAEYVRRQDNCWSRVIQGYSEELVSDASRSEFVEKLSLEHIRYGGSDFSFIYEKLTDYGDFYLQARVSFVHGRDGSLVAVVGTRNVDDLIKKEREQELALKAAFDAAEAANRAKTEFLSNMSHDIRTPMNGIIGMTAIAAAHIDDKERVQDCLKKTSQASKHLLSLINEVLDMSKIESGKVELNEEEFNLSDLIENLLSMTNSQIKEHRHELSVNISGVTHEAVIGDSLRIQKVFTNLMGNAVKYTPDGGKIHLSITEKPSNQARVGCYEVVFEDNGIGMSEEFLGKIFEPFERAGNDSHVSRIQGTGLGMPISRNIVRMMGGDIKVESKLGVGSRFTVTMYLKLQDAADVRYDKFIDLDVLVADDDEISLESCCGMLNDLGMKAEGVSNGADAVEQVVLHHRQKRDYFACIIDWKMPDMDGIATTRAIRQAVGKDVPIIIISAYDWSDIEQEARSAGANAFISKPLFRSRLIKTFSTLVGNDDSEEQGATFVSLEAMDLSGRRVLLVEDNDLNAEIASEILETTGLTVERAADGVEAVDKMTECEVDYYDMVFMDIQMPRMNGYDAAIAIRALDRDYCRQVPIVAMTANAFAEDVHAAKTAGMNEHIAKPLDVNVLARILKKWIL